MKRLIDFHLQNWKNDPDRKSLLLRGARQVGKTYSCRELGQSFDNFTEDRNQGRKTIKYGVPGIGVPGIGEK